MKTRLTLTLLASGPLALAFAACSSDVSDAPTKAEVAQAVGAGEPVDDNVCSDNGWTGDGECDAWCPGGDDGDCSGEDIVCAAFVEANDGVCGRPADDPCKHQDPDCEIECPAIAQVPDGTCNEDPNDPCPTDPDCEIQCPAIAEVPNGVCEEDPGELCPTDPDCDECPTIAELPNGVCDEDPGEPCPTDPDCIECPAIAELPNGVCEELPGEVCPLDPDCPWNQ